MKAVVIHEHGGIDKLRVEQVPDPTIAPDEVLVRVKAVALNHLDLWVRRGLPALKVEMPHILGSDIAGVVEEVGELVRHVGPGDEVILAPGWGCGVCRKCLLGEDNVCEVRYQILGETTAGGYAEFVKAPGSNAFPLPAGISFVEAAAVPLVFLTAWNMLVRKAEVQPGEDVLVLAAGSGVGSAAIQIAKLFGARVIATASTEAKLEMARELGADEVINYAEQDFLAEVRRLTDGRGVDIVFEHVGEATWEKSIKSMARGGRLVTCGATTGYQAMTDLRYVFAKNLTLLGNFMGRKGDLLHLLRFFESGEFRAVVDRSLPLEQAAEAHRLLEERQHFGKIVLTP
jgi:NADPH:quinone reductase-like Zn-dependent oxidoreductase